MGNHLHDGSGGRRSRRCCQPMEMRRVDGEVVRNPQRAPVARRSRPRKLRPSTATSPAKRVSSNAVISGTTGSHTRDSCLGEATKRLNLRHGYGMGRPIRGDGPRGLCQFDCMHLMACRDGPSVETPSSEESEQWAVSNGQCPVVGSQWSVVSEDTMTPAIKSPSSACACGIFRSSRFRGFSGLSRLALGQSQGGSHCGRS
jgi:hypothetical protein